MTATDAPPRDFPAAEPIGSIDIGFAAEQPATAFTLVDVQRKDEGEPHVALRLSRSPLPAPGGPAFAPLRLPDRVRATLVNVGPGLITRLHADLKLQLGAGKYEFPLAEGEPVILDYGEGGTAHAVLDVGPDEQDGTRQAVVRRLEVTFERPVVIHRVLHALREVQSLFEDRTLGPLFRGLAQTAAFQRLSAVLPSPLRRATEMIGQADEKTTVTLERIVATPRPQRKARRPELRLAFSGEVRLLGRVTRRFEDVELPNMLLPTPHARLDLLLSARPLASARLATQQAHVLPFLRAVLASTVRAEGELRLEADIPRLSVDTRFVDGTCVTATLTPPERLVVAGPFEAAVSAERTKIGLRGLKLTLPHEGLQLDAAIDVAHDLTGPERPFRERVGVEAQVSIADGSQIPEAFLDLRSHHPLCVGESVLPLRLSTLAVAGSASVTYRKGALAVWPTTRRFSLAGKLATRGEARMRTAGLRSTTRIENGELHGSLALSQRGEWQAAVTTALDFAHRVEIDVPAIPELAIEAGELNGHVAGHVEVQSALRFGIPALNVPRLDPTGSTFRASLETARVVLGNRKLTLPPRTDIEGEWLRGRLGGDGLDETAVALRWDLHGKPCLLHGGERAVSLLAPGLRQGALTVVLERQGRLRFEGPQKGLYGVQYFNALINPAADRQYLWNLLRSEDALNHVIRGLRVFAPALGDAVADLRMLILQARTVFAREGIEQPRDAIPRPRLARLFSLFLVGNDSLVGPLSDIVRRVTEAQGLDIRAMKRLLDEPLESFELAYEVDRLLRWLNGLLSPTEPIVRPAPRPALPLCEDPRHAAALRDLPSAAELYEAVLAPTGKPGAVIDRIAALARDLSAAQLGWLLAQRRPDWPVDALRRIEFVYEVKRRIGEISEAYGGMAHAPQGSRIAAFLGDAVGALPQLAGWLTEEGEAAPPAALGPEDVATLLHVGLASGRQSRQIQVNNRLLFEYLRAESPEFAIGVLTELGQQSPRAMTHVLFGLLDQEQDQLREPLDLPALLGALIGETVPRKADYMAGGMLARESYAAALDRLGAAILARGEAYLARKAHLQVCRHTPRGEPARAAAAALPLATVAEDAIRRADALGAACRFDERRPAGLGEAQAAYEAAFEACRTLLRVNPFAYQLPWLRAFWARNEEALRVLSMVRNYQDDVDQVRRWLGIRLGLAKAPRGEQALCRACIDALYAFDADRKAVRGDPLVRLLMEPPAGPYDFAIVSAMGVITEGAAGRELHEAYARLGRRYGIRVLRANTATGRSLEYNADRIIDEVRRVTSPWGYIGYSQGCANGLMAESRLLSGTPDEQRLLDTFVGRNLLFSAANGSAHGTSGNLKLARALVEGERMLKPYQATYSATATRTFLRALSGVLDMRELVLGLGGWHSLSFERAEAFHRELQVVERAATSTTRGAVDFAGVPETLEYMYFVLNHLQPGCPHDTQVTIDDACGRATRVQNAWTQALAAADLGSRVQAIHHWSPLSVDAEVAFVATARDRERAVYDSPKDRHVFPWVEALARFGRIGPPPAAPARALDPDGQAREEDVTP